MLNITKIETARPRRAPRQPPVEDINNADYMLAACLLSLVMAIVGALLVWAVMR